MSDTAIVWLRRDLRLADNPALHAALQSGCRVVPLYIHAPDEEAPWQPGAASLWWLHYSLQALDDSLHQLGSRLIIRHGSSLETLHQLISETGASKLYWNRLYEPAVIKRDSQIKTELRSSGIECHSFNAALLSEPWQLLNQQQRPYKVFTAYWRAYQKQLGQPLIQPLPAPTELPSVADGIDSTPIDALRLLPKIDWASGFSHWQAGEMAAIQRLQHFIDTALEGYQDNRDRPATEGTSRLSPHLHFGEISPRQILWALQRVPTLTESEDGIRFQAELGWREFAHYTLYHYPESTNSSLDRRFEQLGWQQGEAITSQLQRWQEGETGIALADAGMRELWQTGWMHNRVRMVVASLLTKNLNIHWLEGARWFWDTLLDADLANNTLGWQWAAGCGVDAAPYFRIFNPDSQAERFDTQRRYIDHWLPERRNRLAPTPIVELTQSRRDALDRWQSLRQQSSKETP